MTSLIELSENQLRHLTDSRQLWEAQEDARRRRRALDGGMTWKVSKGKEYLVKIFSDPGTGRKKMSSVGPRSTETERLLEDFRRAKTDAVERCESIGQRVDEQARLSKAIGIGRVPVLAARIMRDLHQEGMLGEGLRIVGTHSLFAYEAAAGVFIPRGLMATGDLDLFMDARTKLVLESDSGHPDRLLALLRKVDRSFELAPVGFRAINRTGFFVDLVKAEPEPPWKDEPDSLGSDGLVAAPIRNMRWMQSAASFNSVAIGEDGHAVPMTCIDPRGFALYKAWMGTQDPQRDPAKRPRDIAQARIVFEIVSRYLLHLPFSAEHLRTFPRHVVDHAMGIFNAAGTSRHDDVPPVRGTRSSRKKPGTGDDPR